MRPVLILAFACTIILTACSKNGGGDNPGPSCTSVTGVIVTAPATTVAKGQPFSAQATALTNVTYSWKIPGGGSSSAPSVSIVAVDFSNEGWYVVTATNTCGQSKKDSVYLDVTVPTGAANCSPPNNQVSYTAVNHQTATFVTITAGQHPSIPGIYEIQADGSGPGTSSANILFHPSYTNANPPPDGVYTTGTYNGNFPSFSNLDFDKIFVNVITYSPATIVYRAPVGQKIYITKVGGKLKATICDIPMNGSSNGTPYSTNMTLMVTQP